MAKVPEKKRQVRAGGRSARVVSSVLRAASRELARVGYAAFRIEDVAERAGVAKTTVYRRWPTKIELVGAVIRGMRNLESVTPDTGSLRGDIRALYGRIIDMYASPEHRAVARALMSEGEDPEVAALTRRVRAEFFGPWRQVFDRGIARHELPASVDPVVLREVLFAPVAMRLVRTREPVDDAYLDAVLDLVLGGVRTSVRGKLGRKTA